MTPGQVKTARFLLGCGASFVLHLIALACWEVYAVTLDDEATITEVIRLAWAYQPWALALAAVTWVGVTGFVAGHFFGLPTESYEALRAAEKKRAEEKRAPAATYLPAPPRNGADR